MGLRIKGSGCGVEGAGFKVWGSGFRVEGLRFRVWIWVSLVEMARHVKNEKGFIVQEG